VPSYKYLVKIDDDLDLHSAALLACSGLTAYTSVIKSGVQPGENIVMIGAGGLGLMAVQIAKATTNSNVIILDLDDQNLEEAQRLGADEVINSKIFKHTAEKVKSITGGQGTEAVIDFVNNNKTSSDATKMIRKLGRLIMVGLFGGSLELGLASVPLRALTITGAYTGRFDDLVNLVSLAKDGKIRSVVSDKIKMDRVNEALEDLKAGRISGRAVITP
jgi:alcohol dehydrogenase, propanol-preferring